MPNGFEINSHLPKSYMVQKKSEFTEIVLTQNLSILSTWLAKHESKFGSGFAGRLNKIGY